MSQRYSGLRTVSLFIESNVFNSCSKTSHLREIIVTVNSKWERVQHIAVGGRAWAELGSCVTGETDVLNP